MENIKITENNLDKKQPSNLEAEQALIGSILVNDDIIDEVANIINPSSFYDPAHTKVYEVIEILNVTQLSHYEPIVMYFKHFFTLDVYLFLVKIVCFLEKNKKLFMGIG